ncbi:rhomboid-like protein 11, chloroplastic [Oryza brachyantha]|nr:rhomboid-like protein 11, chloroplastic [Oryza brachyantha]
MTAQQLLLLPAPSRTFSKPLPSPPSSLPGFRLSSAYAATAAAGRRDLLRSLRCGMRRSGSDLVPDLELAKDKQWQGRRPNGIFWILLLNVGVYVADHLFQIQDIKAMYLYHAFPTWFQFVTSTFCHANWNHLSSNLFFVYIFGKLVEEEEGSFALWMAYILTGAGSNLISWLFLPTTSVSLGASGAVFGLFTISVLVKMSWDWRKILEVLILGQFVVDKVMEAARATAVTGHSMQVNNIAHLSGALIGAALVFLINRIPFPSDGDSPKSSKDRKEKRS